jgi:hypothetical protein
MDSKKPNITGMRIFARAKAKRSNRHTTRLI